MPLSMPAFMVIELMLQLLQFPTKRSFTSISSVTSTNSTSPPSACKKGRMPFNAISILSLISSLMVFENTQFDEAYSVKNTIL